MDRLTLFHCIQDRLQHLGIPFQTGIGADFVISHTFLDAEWSAGNKRIEYEASILLDEPDQDVNLWERTTETGGGLSGGFSGGSWSQSGTTLFRKVKSVQYGPDGKAYEIELDLGAIPKAVKEEARQADWRFHIVLRKDKAQYKPGQTPPSQAVPVSATSAHAPRVPIADGSFYCIRCGTRLPADSRFCCKCGLPQRQG